MQDYSPPVMFISLLFWVVIIVLIYKYAKRKKQSKDNVEEVDKYGYQYTAKQYIMTRAETDLFRKLYNSVNEKYFIFPQIHLSTILNHKINGQNWRGAFSHINGKSVDYVLCDKNTLGLICAVELDDYTHNNVDRVERDHEVEKILKNAGIPLVRLYDFNNRSDEDIRNIIAEALKK